MYTTIGIVIGLCLLGSAAYISALPWTNYGGRFATECLVVGGTVGFIGLGIAVASFMRL